MLREKENILFESWKKEISKDSGTVFVADGVVDENKWNTASIKVLYLLKEVNGGDNEWDERDYLLHYNDKPEYIKTHSPTIDVLIKWQYGIINGNSVSWEDMQKATANKVVQSELLSQICLVNCKKTAGGSLVDWNDFSAYIEKTVNILNLKEQLSYYSPNIVVCGGTAWFLNQIFEWKNTDWKQTSRGIAYCKKGNTIYIDFCHPNNRGPKNMIYYGLADAVYEITNNI